MSDTDLSRSEVAWAYLRDCPGIFVIGKITRAENDANLNEHLRWAIRKEGIENVCLVLTHKEVYFVIPNSPYSTNLPKASESAPDRCSTENSNRLLALENALEDAELQFEAACEASNNLPKNASAYVKKIADEKAVEANKHLKQRKLMLEREYIFLRDCTIAQSFRDKYCESEHEKRQFNVITISNFTHARHLGSFVKEDSPILSVQEDGISAVRAFMCKGSNKARFQAYKSWIELVLREFRRIRVFTSSKPRLGSKEEIVKVFDDMLASAAEAAIQKQRRFLDASSAKLRDGS